MSLVAPGRHRTRGLSGGLPTVREVGGALAELGVEAVDLRHAELESRGVALIRAHHSDGRQLLVKVYGRDARDGQLLATIWGTVWYRDDTSRLAIRRRDQVEREGFVTLFAERSGAPVAPVVSAGVASTGDALIVLESPGSPLWRADPRTVSDEDLRAQWSALDRLHAAHITHGKIDGNRLLMHGGSVSNTDLVQAQVFATSTFVIADDVQLLVAQALAVGAPRAIRATAEAIGAERLAALLPYLQTPVLSAGSRRRARDDGLDLGDLRREVATASDVEVPKLEQVRRVTWNSFVPVALLLLGACVLITGISGLAIDDISTSSSEPRADG